MAQTPQLKFYKGQTNRETFYNLLPDFNVSKELTEVVNPYEIQQATDYYKGVINKAGGQEAEGLKRRLSDFQSGISSEFVLNDKGILAEPKQVAAQRQQAQQLASGQVKNLGTAQAPLIVPLGTPTPQQSNAAFQAAQPKPQYQETPRAAQYPGEAIDISKTSQEGFEAAKAAGYQSPSTYEGAIGMFNQFLPSQQGPSAVDTFISQDPYLNSVVANYQNYMSQQNQRTSLVEEYQNLLKSSGIQGIDTELINMKNVIEGSEEDIRTEITKAGGFATESAVIALTNVRNKQLIKNYNTLLETRNSKERYLDTLLNLTQQDRQAADQRFETQMNFGFKIAEINQQMKQNAISTIDRVAQTLGWDGVFNATQGNTQLQRQIEMTYGLPRGGLAIAAQRQYQERMYVEQERELGIQEKISGIQEKELGMQFKEQQLRFGEEDRPLELQERKMGLSLKAEHIKTEQAQRAKIYSDIQKIQKEQQGSILDPKTPEGAKQLATMRGQVDLIQGLLGDKNLKGAVGPTGIARFAPIQALTGGKANFIAGIEQLRSGLNLQALIDAKSRGATFGALSDNELQVLANAATKIGSWTIKDKNGNAKGYRANEKDFKRELDKINNFAKLDYIYRGGNPGDVGVQVIGEKYYTKNSDGSITEL